MVRTARVRASTFCSRALLAPFPAAALPDEGRWLAATAATDPSTRIVASDHRSGLLLFQTKYAAPIVTELTLL